MVTNYTESNSLYTNYDPNRYSEFRAAKRSHTISTNIKRLYSLFLVKIGFNTNGDFKNFIKPLVAPISIIAFIITSYTFLYQTNYTSDKKTPISLAKTDKMIQQDSKANTNTKTNDPTTKEAIVKVNSSDKISSNKKESIEDRSQKQLATSTAKEVKIVKKVALKKDKIAKDQKNSIKKIKDKVVSKPKIEPKKKEYVTYKAIFINKKEIRSSQDLKRLYAKINRLNRKSKKKILKSAKVKKITREIGVRKGFLETIKIKPGDTLSSISQRAYGDSKYAYKILHANPDKLTNPNRLRVGQTLRIPN
jgi:nucleoid-associated protein YgaU